MTSLSDEDDPSTPRRRERTNKILNKSHSLLQSPPPTPTAALKALHDITNEAERLRARVGIQNGRIRELQNTEAGRKRKGDRRRVPGQARIFDQDELNQLREERDRRDEQARGRGRGRGRGGGRGRGRGRGQGCSVGQGQGSTRIHESSSDNSDDPDGAGDLSRELIDSFNGEVPSIVDDKDMESEEEEMMHKIGSKRRSVTPVYNTRSRKRPRA